MRIDFAYTATPFTPVDFMTTLPTGTPCDEAATARQAADAHKDSCPATFIPEYGVRPRPDADLVTWDKEQKRLEAAASAKEKACADYQRQQKAKTD